jgi:hypothetical protein
VTEGQGHATAGSTQAQGKATSVSRAPGARDFSEAPRGGPGGAPGANGQCSRTTGPSARCSGHAPALRRPGGRPERAARHLQVARCREKLALRRRDGSYDAASASRRRQVELARGDAGRVAAASCSGSGRQGRQFPRGPRRYTRRDLQHATPFTRQACQTGKSHAALLARRVHQVACSGHCCRGHWRRGTHSGWGVPGGVRRDSSSCPAKALSGSEGSGVRPVRQLRHCRSKRSTSSRRKTSTSMAGSRMACPRSLQVC